MNIKWAGMHALVFSAHIIHIHIPIDGSQTTAFLWNISPYRKIAKNYASPFVTILFKIKIKTCYAVVTGFKLHGLCMQFKWERSTKKRNNNNPNNIHLQNREQKHANKAPKRGTRENWKFSRKFSSKRQMIMGFFCSVCPSLCMWWACSALLPARSGNLCDEIKF